MLGSKPRIAAIMLDAAAVAAEEVVEVVALHTVAE
jgi:hypothetical protein